MSFFPSSNVRAPVVSPLSHSKQHGYIITLPFLHLHVYPIKNTNTMFWPQSSFPLSTLTERFSYLTSIKTTKTIYCHTWQSVVLMHGFPWYCSVISRAVSKLKCNCQRQTYRYGGLHRDPQGSELGNDIDIGIVFSITIDQDSLSRLIGW